MKESYYERLGVEETADAGQIKRAYYTLVKQTPPERFPEEYKKLRAAYDTLSNAETRAEYDQARSLPEDAADLFEQAEKFERIGLDARAAELYEQILGQYPDLTQVRAALARSFERQNKIGKAISAWEDICEREPESGEYAYALAVNYDRRGWNKKAAAQYRRTVELDGGTAEYWVALLNSHLDPDSSDEGRSICEQALRSMEEHGRESMRLYAFAVVFAAQSENTETAERYLGEIVRIMRSGGSPKEDPEQVVLLLLEAASLMGKTGFVKYIREMAATLPHIDDDLREQLAEADRAAEIDSLTEQGFSVLFHDLFATLINGCDCEDCRMDLLAMECHLLANQSAYRPELLRLRKEFPHLYAMHADFFNEALRTRDLQKLLYQRLKALSKKGMVPAGFEEEDEFGPVAPVQPIRRTEPKIGRNDPCPCGSGKKYKKCCGQ